MRRNKTTTWFGNSYPLSVEEEQDLVDIIQAGKDSSQPELRQRAEYAIDELVGAYSPLIEKIAREKYPGSGGYAFTYEDFVAEAYLVAVQCAKTFRPDKGRKVIRFSAYVSRAIVSSLTRMSLRSRSVVHIPATVMSDARKWSHVYYEMVNKGMEPDDDDVSEISGVDYNATDMRVVLGATFDHPIEEASHPAVEDPIKLFDQKHNTDELISKITKAYGDDAHLIIHVLGIVSGEAKTSPFFLKLATHDHVDETIFDRLPTLLNHPVFKTRMVDEEQQN